ncbi:acyltransferase [Microbacterium sp. BK668]|uniref:acyltransferase family protein n=1 Tax=Microbacterium sp. BK668 TaxID=2512118 RepID=UPI00105D7D78|nr:acyltransferase [Microbacterium sp. BK668]TDN90556.1 peptidoglycan/LPS O-acetylase OafA/YrhL [Microbacterium sp. BK668]
MPSAGVTAGKFHIPSLNGMRALAITLVVWGHAELPLRLIRESTGVTIFFFLSGYLITTLLRREYDARDRVSVADFYLRRVFRIFPPLYVVLICAVVLSLANAIPNEMTPLGVFASFSFWANYYIIWEGRDGLPGGMNALWSLAVEEHFYLVFPLLYIALRRWVPTRWVQAVILGGLCVAIMVWRTYLFSSGASYDRIYLATDTRADAILWGSVFAVVLNPVYGEVQAPRRKWLLTPVLLAGAGVVYAVSRWPNEWGMTIGYTVQSVALAAVFIPVILIPGSVVGRVLNWRAVAWVGIVSYSIYLLHRPVLILTETYIGQPELVAATVGVAATVLASWAMLVYVERPFARLRQRVNRAGETENVART